MRMPFSARPPQAPSRAANFGVEFRILRIDRMQSQTPSRSSLLLCRKFLNSTRKNSFREALLNALRRRRNLYLASGVRRFNGAAVFQPRKRGTTLRRAIAEVEASMGPRSFNRGNASTNAARQACLASSLQWGRGLSTAETARLAS